MSRTTIGASNLNILPAAALTHSASDYVSFLSQGEFDTSAGFEWSDLRLPAARRAGRTLAAIGMIQVVHESWNENSIWEACANLEALKIAAAFPRLDKSYGQLDKLQVLAGKKLPIIVHPAGQHLGGTEPKQIRQSQPDGIFDEIWYQPTVEWAAAQGIATDSEDTAAIAEQISSAQIRNGLDKTAVDIHHLTAERNGMRFRNPGDLAVAMVQSSSFGELQVSIRPDFGDNRSSLALACSGRLVDTPTGEIMSAIASAVKPPHPIRVISEIPATEIRAAGQRNIAEAHAVINHSIRTILG
ncbi:MAG TPA: hypothetical protein VF575_03935 [Candidatus Saccharimonadales bacterium]|jgi:hypothetical protein